jgi:hypothetical protein
MNQQSLFPIEVVDPDETESEAHAIARREAYDVYTAALLHRTYTRKAAEILASGDVYRIRLYRAWLNKQRMAA